MDFQLFMVWFFFLSLLWIFASSPACTHVPYIRVLCPWDWIFAFHGLVFFFVPMDLSLWSYMHFSSIHECFVSLGMNFSFLRFGVFFVHVHLNF
jgi:hypothetical protein